MSAPLQVYTNRSAMVDYRNCPALRYNRYHLGGKGLSGVEAKPHLERGNIAHEALAAVCMGQDPRRILDEGLAKWSPEDQVVLKVAFWAWVRVRLPEILENYEILEVEQSYNWSMGTLRGIEVIQQLRVDGLLRDRLSDGLYYLEFKTTSTKREGWERQWERNTQVLINTLALEEVRGERIDGVLIEGLVKNPFMAYYYRSPKTGEIQRKYRQGWDKTLVEDPEAYVMQLPTAQVADLCVPVPPIRPVPAHLARKRAELLNQEVTIAEVSSKIPPSPEAMVTVFPHHEEHCRRFFDYPCEFLPLCFDAGVAADPLGSGLYQPRIPHHPENPYAVSAVDCGS